MKYKLETQEDGTQILYYTGSKSFIYPDGRVKTIMDAGHEIEMMGNNVEFTINWDVLKYVGVHNLNEVKGITKVIDGELSKTTVVFNNDALFICWHDQLGMPVNIHCEGGTCLSFNTEGDELTAKQPQSSKDVVSH